MGRSWRSIVQNEDINRRRAKQMDTQGGANRPWGDCADRQSNDTKRVSQFLGNAFADARNVSARPSRVRLKLRLIPTSNVSVLPSYIVFSAHFWPTATRIGREWNSPRVGSLTVWSRRGVIRYVSGCVLVCHWGEGCDAVTRTS